MTEEEFHQQRRMWAVIDNKLRVAPENDPRSHIDWFLEEGWLPTVSSFRFDDIVRGFVDPRGLFGYRGRNFSVVGVARAFRQHFEAFETQLGVKRDTECFAGMWPQQAPGVWKPKLSLGGFSRFTPVNPKTAAKSEEVSG